MTLDAREDVAPKSCWDREKGGRVGGRSERRREEGGSAYSRGCATICGCIWGLTDERVRGSRAYTASKVSIRRGPTSLTCLANAPAASPPPSPPSPSRLTGEGQQLGAESTCMDRLFRCAIPDSQASRRSRRRRGRSGEGVSDVPCGRRGGWGRTRLVSARFRRAR